MTWLKWLPWRYVVRYVAHKHGFIDPKALLARLRSGEEATFAALVVLMIFRPQGLFPVRQQLLAYGRSARTLLGSADDSRAPR